MTAVGISSRWEPENSRNVTWIYLPASKGQIERAMQRSGIADPKDMRLWIADSSFPEEVDVALDSGAITSTNSMSWRWLWRSFRFMTARSWGQQ